MSNILYVVVLLAAFGGYWWWSQGRKGNAGLNEHLGLGPGDVLKTYVTGRHHVETGGGDLAAAAVGMQRVGKTVTLVLTQGNALVVRTEGDPPLRLTPGALRLTRVKENVDRLSGTDGKSDTADVYDLAPGQGPVLRIVLARSAADMLTAWSSGAA